MAHMPFSDVTAAPELVPCQIPDGPWGTLTSWETHRPRPVIPASVGNLEEPGQDVYRLWLKYLLFSQVPPPGPAAPSVVQSNVIEGSPDLPGVSFPPAALLASPLSPQTPHSPLRSWEDSFDIYFYSGKSWFSPAQKVTLCLEALEEGEDREC